jgi:N-acetylglutamate synthase-like GNAT family acetyltransferase
LLPSLLCVLCVLCAAACVNVLPVQALLDPLERSGVLVKRSTEELRVQLQNFTVIERETKVRKAALPAHDDLAGSNSCSSSNCLHEQ